MSNVQEHIHSNLGTGIVYACVLIGIIFCLRKKHKLEFRLPVVLLLLLGFVQCVGKLLLATCYARYMFFPTEAVDIYRMIYLLSCVIKLSTMCLIPLLLLSCLGSLSEEKAG